MTHKTVPRSPDNAMIRAGKLEAGDNLSRTFVGYVWQAMYDAAPVQPMLAAPEQGDAVALLRRLVMNWTECNEQAMEQDMQQARAYLDAIPEKP
jgi:hypothetical protein